MTEKTLVEIAVEFNIEINRLRNKINYEKRKGNMIGFKRDGVLFLNNDDVKTIKRLFDVVENPVEFNNEFGFFKTQLEEKDKQISMLHQALDQQQILTKQALDDKKELQIELAENQNKSFWQRLLKK
ncbi:DUF536 domain-containing protein [Lactococcus lactis subsp. lactis]|uniref:DUF536 domain-containing protein n=1 Tax=Lactococcus lactis TaxID=1358 RepID=UPI000D59CA1A|nr:DUF536 domain-containing protein [Lactococcus lactis]AWJ95574.1 hypothetical protein P620_14190 [Lactococcus lactis subsp. lactis KLDS 4.0325]MBR8675493.1 DUF536 domain-containing protein [Lactococcus lactis subsp. lactis]MBR8678259.1 DUF536 domain-containing protein [Lactococcus lactis subsp. lactis]MBR8685744.1 DUF536 domain-containing protein [Lactococcus lactis subsp. lactis]RXS49938.1 DUF536 domain-containing protein [Lactococcus lactis]